MFLRTQRVALDWLFDRINLDPKIKMKFVDTRSQLAYILAKGTFIPDEWNHLLQLLNIMDISMFSRSFLRFRIGEFSAMSMRQMQDGKGEKITLAWLQSRDLSWTRWTLSKFKCLSA